MDFEERSGENLGGEDQTNFPEKRQIASRIGITLETFSRSLRKLEATGEIAASPKLRTLDRAVLYELSR
ncbi:helix-turn-helix domain-containing protein [Thalassospira xianhensis]|uniref:helix-turn-helix domain-containing protein n=1 Tax=Thalassospira xianhensis TaxID=478503 RepID=UPI003CC58CE8